MFIEKPRRVIPRWRDYRTTIALRELDDQRPPSPPSPETADAMRRAAVDWSEQRTVWHAGNLLSSAYTAGSDFNCREAAEFVIANQLVAPAPLIALARAHLGEANPPGVDVVGPILGNDDVFYLRIHTIKRRISDEPRNPMLWVEVARLYIQLGQQDSALRAMAIAAKLGGDNRFIVRSAARLFLHAHDAGKALQVIRSASGARVDPWLLSAEISVALASKSPSLLARVGQQRNGDEGLSAFARTELSSALATLEMDNGKSRHARQLFRQSLSAPNDNSLAQAEWANREMGGGIEIQKQGLDLSKSYEAMAQVARSEGRWNDAIEAGEQWFLDERFSKRPAILVSFLCSLTGRYDQAERILKSSLKSNPNDPELINNLAFSLASMGRPAEAARELSKVDYGQLPPTSEITLAATKGLINFRLGFPEKGRELYELAIARATRSGISKYAAFARLYLSREQLLTSTAGAVKFAWDSLRVVAKSNEIDVAFVAAQVQALLERMAPTP